MVLWAGAIAAVALWVLVCRAVFPHLFAVAKATQILGGPRLSLSLVYSILNAVFEELLWLGLGFAAFRRFGVGVAGTISAALRLLAHVYQGPLALVTVLPVGVVFTLYYVRTRRLWPVVVAHAFQDTLALEPARGSFLFGSAEHQLNQPPVFRLGDQMHVVSRLQQRIGRGGSSRLFRTMSVTAEPSGSGSSPTGIPATTRASSI